MNTGTNADALGDVYAHHYQHQLYHTARLLLWDWREAALIAEEARKLLEAKRDKIEADAARYQSREDHYGVLLGAVGGAFTRLIVDRRQVLGYDPPECEAGIRAGIDILELSEEWATAERAERAELDERIETLPVVLREPMRLWLDDKEVPESLGWYVRQGLTLLGRRRAAA